MRPCRHATRRGGRQMVAGEEEAGEGAAVAGRRWRGGAGEEEARPAAVAATVAAAAAAAAAGWAAAGRLGQAEAEERLGADVEVQDMLVPVSRWDSRRQGPSKEGEGLGAQVETAQGKAGGGPTEGGERGAEACQREKGVDDQVEPHVLGNAGVEEGLKRVTPSTANFAPSRLSYS